MLFMRGQDSHIYRILLVAETLRLRGGMYDFQKELTGD